MTADLLGWLAIAFIGLAGGIAVGSGMVAFLVVLDIIPRLCQLTRSCKQIHIYEGAVVAGSLVFTWLDMSDVHVHLFALGAGVFGLFAGCFVGMLAAALTEVINVLPILAKRVGMGPYMLSLLMAMIFGKVFGSLFEWLIY
ncbi:stage V sporulation protein AB [Paenibacillus athensensis]|uniref:Stage V sporulation protein AB n=1 Tax=Paenibacillus athensensis TaxID=1967502 RepID=A0A4Y8Q1E4_9BACL|nr:stage V sporulation protein AB [Paenibacillus athensensis]MCD1260746.1 stage V sporulation protein AB [Paenibacillus athensensis]